MKRKLLLIIFLGIILGGVVFWFSKHSLNKISTDNTQSKPTAEKKQTHYSYLFLGYGGANHEGTYLTDTIMIVNIDTERKIASLISVPRDLWIKLPTKSGNDFYTKINAVYQMDLFPDQFPDVKKAAVPGQTIKGVTAKITGLNVESYLAIDFSTFIKTIDVLGGIDINVDQSFEDDQYPIDGKKNDPCGKTDTDLEEAQKIATESPELAFPCRYEKLSFVKGLTHMDGDLALKYVRSRHGNNDAGDFNRARRQQLFINAIKGKIVSIDFIPKILPLFEQVKKDVKTDVGLSGINLLRKELGSLKQYQIRSLVISDQNLLSYSRSVNGQSILIPKAGIENWQEIANVITNLRLDITPSPSQSLIPTVKK